MAKYPLPVFHFQVDWAGTNLGFSEVSGLTMESQPIEYRDGSMKETSPLKMAGITKWSNITLKRGVTVADNEFFDWWKKTVDLGNVERRDITISLLNETQEPVMVWKVKNAWPVKVEGPGLKATGNEIAIESMEVAHEGLVVENG